MPTTAVPDGAARPDDVEPETDATCDAFLGGRIAVLQPRRGRHRAGHDAILLAAALAPDAAGCAVDLGSGVGVAGMAAAARCPGLRVTLVDDDATALALARASLALPANAALAGRVKTLEADVLAPGREREAKGLARASADVVLMNPPFFPPGTARPSPEPARARAHLLASGIEPWLRAAAATLKPRGVLALIFRADGLAEILPALRGRFGAPAILPVHPRLGEPATRIVLRARKGERGRLAILPGLVLHRDKAGAPTPEAAAILRDGAPLPFRA